MVESLVKQDTTTSWYLNRKPVEEYLERKPKQEKSGKDEPENSENFSWHRLIQNVGVSED